MQWTLVLFGWIFIVAIVAIIVVPYVRQRADLMTGWNLFLLGSINFVGISAIQSGMAFEHLYSTQLDSDYVKFVLGAVAFFATGVLTYKFFPLPRRWGANRFRSWGSYSTPALILLAGVCLVLVIGYLFVPNIQFLGQFMVFFGMNASTLGIVFLLTAWRRRPFNVVLLVMACVPFVGAAIISNMGFGRREFVAVLMTLPLCLYWWRWRYAPAASTLIKVGLLGVVGVIALTGISISRSIISERNKSLTEVAIDKLAAIPSAFRPSAVRETVVGGDTTDASLACIRHYDRQGSSHPFFTLYYIAVHPIPRAWWPEKPEALGKTLPGDLGIIYVGEGFSLGPGIVGHGFHEGGVWMLAFYGFLFAAVFRFFDEVLVREHDNPYVLGTLCAVSGHVLGLSRGDVAVFIVHLIAGLLTAVLLSTLARILFGTMRREEPMPAGADGGAAEQSGYGEVYGDFGVDPSWQAGRQG